MADPAAFDEIVCVNDSVYGPLFDLAPAFRDPRIAAADFWRTVEPQACKDDVIDRYELGMTEHFLRAGFRMAALYDARARGIATWAEIRPHVALTEPRRPFAPHSPASAPTTSAPSTVISPGSAGPARKLRRQGGPGKSRGIPLVPRSHHC